MILHIVLTIITHWRLKCFVATRNPANGIIASLGIGKIILSIIIHKKTVIYPVCWINAVMYVARNSVIHISNNKRVKGLLLELKKLLPYFLL